MDEKENVDFEEMATSLVRQFQIKTNIESKEMYIYHPTTGIYEPGGEEWLREEVTAIAEGMGQRLSQHTMKEVIYRIQSKTFVETKNIDMESHLIHLGNCILNTETLEMIAFTPEIIATQRIEVDYDPEAICPNFLKFLSEIVKEDDIPVIQEMFGWTLWKEYKPQKAFILLGSGANGKSTLLNALVRLLGKKNVSAIELAELDQRFMGIELQGKLANICTEIKSKKLSNATLFKKLTGDDLTKGERKNKNPVYFRNFAKLLFSANKLPESPDFSNAFYRRWIILEFPNNFKGSEININLLDEITTESELKGILNWAIQGLQRLLENKKFSVDESSEELAEKWERLSSPVEWFLSKFVEETGDKTDCIEKTALYEKFIEFPEVPAMSTTAFNKAIQRLCKKCWPGQRSSSENDETKPKVWRGMKWNNSVDSS